MTIDDLKTYGANTEEGLRRCLNNEAFYLRLVRMIPGDPTSKSCMTPWQTGTWRPPLMPPMRSRAAPGTWP